MRDDRKEEQAFHKPSPSFHPDERIKEMDFLAGLILVNIWFASQNCYRP